LLTLQAAPRWPFVGIWKRGADTREQEAVPAAASVLSKWGAGLTEMRQAEKSLRAKPWLAACFSTKVRQTVLVLSQYKAGIRYD
jgi:hypothetical protein